MTDPSPTATEHELIIVSGSGRSGTSTVAGTLNKLGLYVPQPEIPANDANPRGYFEPLWVVEFHKRVLADAGVRTNDGRPAAPGLVGEVNASKELRTELREWLSTQLQAPQIVVKDPRTFWLRDLWVDAANDLGVRTSFVTMLRHPAEVVGSRDMHYLKDADEEKRKLRETGNLAGWVNVGLVCELNSRGGARAFAHYTDLISDWRGTMAGVGEKLGLSYNADLATDEHHAVDDFIDSSLRRSQLTFDDLDAPQALKDVAGDVWDALEKLAVDPADADAIAAMDDLRDRYAQMYSDATALSQDHTSVEVAAARKQVRRKVTKDLEEKYAGQATPPDTGPAPSLAHRVVRRIRRQLGR